MHGNIFNELFYSLRNASIGFNNDALYAGNIPKIRPINIDTQSDNTIVKLDTIKLYPRIIDISPNIIPNIIPNNPPVKHSIKDSNKN